LSFFDRRAGRRSAAHDRARIQLVVTFADDAGLITLNAATGRWTRRIDMFVRSAAIAVIGCALAAVGGQAGAGQPPPSVDARQHRQAQRIRNGNQNGELTKGEKDRLRGDEAAIRAEERVYRRSGNGLSPAERRDLQKDLDKTSREIYRFKHNDRQP